MDWRGEGAIRARTRMGEVEEGSLVRVGITLSLGVVEGVCDTQKGEGGSTGMRLGKVGGLDLEGQGQGQVGQAGGAGLQLEGWKQHME